MAFELIAVHINEGAAFGLPADVCDDVSEQVGRSAAAAGVPFCSARLEEVFDLPHRADGDTRTPTDSTGQLHSLLQVQPHRCVESGPSFQSRLH